LLAVSEEVCPDKGLIFQDITLCSKEYKSTGDKFIGTTAFAGSHFIVRNLQWMKIITPLTLYI